MMAFAIGKMFKSIADTVGRHPSPFVHMAQANNGELPDTFWVGWGGKWCCYTRKPEGDKAFD